MIGIVDYGLGNVRAFANIYQRLNIPVCVVGKPGELETADRIILPGVGAFDWAMTQLQASGMRACLEDLVLVKKRAVLGVCVGMQMMARGSEEGRLSGLGWIDGDVKRFDERACNGPTQLPHMGWNDVAPVESCGLFRDMTSPRFYFLHSYYFAPDRTENVLASTDYNGPFASAVYAGNVFGTQFHPEKSHDWGVQLLKNFAEF